MKRTILPSKNTITNSLKIVIENSKKNLLLTLIGLSTIKSLFASGELTVTLTPSNVNCQGLKTGQITANVTGGQPPYQYRWSNGATTQSISNLNPGYYHCKVLDNNNNLKSEAEITLTESEVLRIVQYDATVYPNNFNTSCYSCNDGVITVAVAGGTPPYTYLWSDGSTQQNRTNLVAKDYQLVVTDAFGCQVRELNKELSKPERDDWTAGGNAGTNPANQFVGTTDNKPILFKTYGQERFRLSESGNALFTGNIGLGTTAPTEKLDIEGGLRVRGINSNLSTIPFNANEVRLVTSDIDGNLKTTLVEVRDGALNCTKKVLAWSARPNLSGVSYSTANGLTIYPPDSEHPDDIVKCPQIGNVGIGVLQPNYKVDVLGDVNASGYRIDGEPIQLSQWTTTSSNYAGKNITFKTSNDNANTVSIGYACNQNLRWSNAYFGFNAKRDANNINFVSKGNSSSNNGGSLIYSNSTGAMFFSVIPPNGAGNDQTYNDNFVTQHEVLELNQYGVHINKPLTVEGTTILNGETHTRRVKVCAGNGWCDYVFDKDYKLTSLIDVEKYIKANNHLPDVPSAKEVANSEIDLFEMQKIQMKKIEELMLYVIELKKENQNMVKEIAQLKK